MCDIVDSKVEQQYQAKLRKGSAGEITTPYQRITVSPNKARFRQCSSFILAYPTSLNFSLQNISNPMSRMNINSNKCNSFIKFTENFESDLEKSLLNNIYKDINFELTDGNDSQTIMDNRKTLDSMRSNKQIHTRDQLFSDGSQVGLNDRSTEKSK
ncbi:13153_t:CDS:2, partial [Funneliformis geosporum]